MRFESRLLTMKVLLVSPDDLQKGSGVNKQVFGLQRLLAQAGIEAHIAGTSSSAHRFGDRVHSFFQAFDGTKKCRVIIESQMASLLTRESFDVVHAYDPLSGPLGTAALLAERTVATFFSRPLATVERRWLDRLLARRSSAVLKHSELIATSRSVQADVREAFSRDATVIPVGVDFGRYHPQARPIQVAADPRASLLRVLFVGDWQQKERGFDLLYAALERVATTRPVELVVVGSQPKPGLAQTASLHVRFLGQCSELRLPELYRHADLVVAPALDKRASGSALLEAMACGAAVVASDVGPYHEITAGSGAVLFPAGNLEALTSTLNVLAARPDERVLRGEANALAAQSYRWDLVGKEVIAIYGRLSPAKPAAEPRKVASPRSEPMLSAPVTKLRSLAN